ncbi:MAG: chaperonin GroEL [Clostridia bacterium]|nr:chaperonin GroEL [Clostridia bacterium]
MNKAQKALYHGVNKLNNIVKITIGPNGRNVIIDRNNGSPLITNDGVTIAKEVTLPNRHENLGADVIKQASLKTNTEAGDGTTSAIVLATAITNQARRAMLWGYQPMELKDALITAAHKALDLLPQHVRQIHKYEDLLHVAANSCGNDEDGALVAKALSKVGTEGLISLEMNQIGTTQLTFTNGVKLAAQIASPYLKTKSLHQVKVLVTNGTIKTIQEILPILEDAVQNKTPLLLVAADYTPEVINALVLNRAKAGLQIVAVRSQAQADCAVITNATLISPENDLTLARATNAHLGHANQVIFEAEHMVILSDERSPSFEQHLAMIKDELDSAPDDYHRTRLKERLANLTATAGVISVGCPTEAATMEKRLRIEDAVAATTNAMRDGVVIGGGLTYLKIAQDLDRKDIGERILKRALPAIYRQINRNYHFDAKTCTAIDAATVIKSVIQNATSAAAILITTGEIISNAI